MTGYRLPRSLDPLTDESISGYLLRLAHRLDMAPTRLVVAAGLLNPAGGNRYHAAARVRLLIGAEPAALRRFAHTTRLTDAEATALFLSGYGERYPPARARPEPTGRRGGSGRLHLGQWLFIRSTRYCPDCLAGDSSDVQRRHGGSWRRAWRLPVVFACTTHRRYLQHRCATGGHLIHHREHGFLPGWRDHTLHPNQCRATIGPPANNPHTAHAACQARLTEAPAAATPSAAMLRMQRRMLDALDPTGPDTVEVLGQHTSAARYFIDLIQLSYLIRRSWPLARDLVPAAVLADALEQHLDDEQRHIADRCQQTSSDYGMLLQNQHRTPPTDAVACAALLAGADALLTLGSPRDLTGHLRHLLTHDPRRPGRADWTRRFLVERPDSSEGLRQAVAPVLQTYARDRRGRALHAPIRRTPFGPEHIAQFLQADWFQHYLAHFDGINPTHLRRTAALHLCQMTAGGSVREAAVRLGLPDTESIHYRCYSSVGAVHAWARQRSDPHEFEAAVHDLADHIEASTHRIDFHHRRAALWNWSIDTDAWQHIVAQLPPWIDGGKPELGDRKRQCASIIVWSRLTGSEHVFAPHPIRDRQPDHHHNAWRLSAYSMFARFRDGCTRPHDIALNRLLVDYAQQLAADIDAAHRVSTVGQASKVESTPGVPRNERYATRHVRMVELSVAATAMGPRCVGHRRLAPVESPQ